MRTGRSGAGARRGAVTAVTRETGRPPAAHRDRLTIEHVVGFSSPGSFRISPDRRSVAYIAEAADAKQLFVLPLEGGYPRQITASEKPVSDPQWSPDGTRLCFVREKAIWVVGVDGSGLRKVVDHPAGNTSPRWSPRGDRLAFLSRRRGWDQVWLVELPIDPPDKEADDGRERKVLPDPQRLTTGPYDNEEPAWSRDASTISFVSLRSEDLLTKQVHVVDVEGALAGAAHAERQLAGESSWACGASWTPDGRGLVFVDDLEGWFHVYRMGRDGDARQRLTHGEVEHGEPSGAPPYSPRVSPDGRHVAHIRVRDGLIDLVVRPLDDVPGSSRDERVVNPSPGIWRLVDWLGDDHLAATREDTWRPQDLWVLPVPGLAAGRGRPRQITHSLPAVVRTEGFAAPERVRFTARDGLGIEGTLWLPRADGAPHSGSREDGGRFPVVIYPHGGPTWQTYVGWWPLFQLFAQEGMATLAIDFRGSTGYGKVFRWANRGEWGHGDLHDLVDGARWALEQPWADGRLGIFGGSYGGYMTLAALVEEPALWQVGVDLYGDSEIAESYRHGDRVGRIDLERMMGRPDDPGAAELYRRGSPVYRAERIEAPLLILHGRKDKRVVPLMTERMVEALEIEGKFHEVHWYDEEAHGWERRENRRDAYERILTFLKRHLLGEDEPESDPGG